MRRPRPPKLANRADDDAQLVEAARAGDTEAMTALIDRCGPAIARGLAAAGYTAGFMDYEDAQQDALATIVDQLPRLDSVASPCAWMHTVARNRAIGRTRAKEVRRRSTERLLRQTAASDVAVHDSYRLGEEASVQELASLVVGALPGPYRDVVVAYYLDEKPVTDIAAELSVAEDTVYTRLRRARRAMLAVLREHGHA